MPNRRGDDLKKRSDDLKRALRRHPAKGRVYLERGSKHTKVCHKDTRKVICTIPDTPSDWRAIPNVVATLRREGILGPQRIEGVPVSYDTPSMDLIHDGMRVLRYLGWEPNQRGRGGGALREFGKQMQAAALIMGGIEVHPSPDYYAKMAGNTLLRGKHLSHLNLDILQAAIDNALATGMIPAETNGKPEVVEAADVSELPKVEYAPESEPEMAQIGPLYDGPKHPAIEDALFIDVLAAMMDSNTSKSMAVELALRVAKLEGF